MKLRVTIIVALICFVAQLNHAQMTVTNSVGVASGVKNKPFSADTVTITDRTLADGNRIHQEVHGKECRDSEGRQYTEHEVLLGDQSRRTTMIFDPVRRVTTILNDQAKTAIVNHLPDPAGLPRTSNPVPSAVRRVEMKREDLGVQTVEGTLARGTRITRTIPAGAEGNDQPIVSVTEMWRADDLNVTILSKTNDPRNGTTEHRLTNIQRAEPDAGLFQVPADYVIKDNAPR